MTNETGRTLNPPLDFLPMGRWPATIQADDAAPGDVARSTRIVEVGPAEAATLQLVLAANGGAAVRLTPVLRPSAAIEGPSR